MQLNDFNDAAKNLKSYLVTIGKALENSGWLVGNSMTVADLILANVLVFNFQTFLDGGFRKAPGMKAVEEWANKIYTLDSFKKVHGNIQMC